ncbi:MAG: hypothetical protein DLM61_21865 [Pseudonocardiales bacterium]|nr:MAG: hypothetical protein DLM61_21865 [Pseudonocardiales bacterium]
MRSINRTALAFLVGAVLVVVAGVIGNQLGLGSWGFTGLAVIAGLLATLVDREGFYGTPPRR